MKSREFRKNMVKNIFLFLFVAGLWVPTTWAHPPTEINLNYDDKAKMLHLDVKHVTNNIQHHRIREIQVFQNDKTIAHLYFANQPKPTGLTQDIPLEAVKGARIRVIVYSSQTGPKEETLIIP